jgi:SAM-dependent methyltransferase
MSEVQRLDPARETASGCFWDSRARRYAARTARTTEGDPFLARVRRLVGARTTVLDVGAGTGRFALALAPRAAEVVAVDPSRGMLAELRREARRLGLANIRCIQGRWDEVDVSDASAGVGTGRTGMADLAISSYVLPVVEDAPRFLARLDRAARRRVLVYLGAFSTDALVDPVWRHFHGKPRRPGPTYLDAVAVLEEIGISPDVEVVEVTSSARFDSIGEAVKEYRDHLLLPDTAEVRRELRELVPRWLVHDRDGWRLAVRTLPAAILSWSPSG